eukprot:4693804-Amphidinium_carterae.1
MAFHTQQKNPMSEMRVECHMPALPHSRCEPSKRHPHKRKGSCDTKCLTRLEVKSWVQLGSAGGLLRLMARNHCMERDIPTHIAKHELAIYYHSADRPTTNQTVPIYGPRYYVFSFSVHHNGLMSSWLLWLSDEGGPRATIQSAHAAKLHEFTQPVTSYFVVFTTLRAL